MSPLLLFALSVVAYAVIPLLAAAKRTRFQFVLLYSQIAAILVLGGVLGAIYVLPITGDIALLAGQVSYGAFMFTTLLTVIVGRDVQIIRNIIVLTVFVNALVFTIFWISNTAMSSSDVPNPLGVPSTIFGTSLWIAIAGGVLIVAELLLLLAVLEVAKRRLPSAIMAPAYVLSFIGIVTLDGVFFPSFVLLPATGLFAFTAAGVQAKLLLALFYAVPLVVFIALNRPLVRRFEATPLRLRGLLWGSRDELIESLESREAELAETQRSLRRSDEHAEVMTQMAAQVARMGGWRLEVPSFEITWSAAVRKIHEVPDDYIPVIDTAINFYAPEFRDEIRRLVDLCVNEGTPFDTELVLVTYTGRQVWVRSIGEAVRDDDGRVCAVQGAFQDISGQKELQAREAEMAERLQLTLAAMTDAFFLLDEQWRFTYLNPAAQVVLQRSSDDLLGKVVWEEFPDALGTEFEVRYRRVAETGDAETFEASYPGLELILEVAAYRVPDGVAVYFRDVGNQRLLEEQLRQSQRLEAVGQLTGGVAHDFNNLLTVILGNAELLDDALEGLPQERELAKMTVQAAERGAELTRSLLAFARRQPLAPKSVDVDRLLAGLDSLLRRTLGEHVELEISRTAGLWPVLIDPAQLENAVLNLALNARDAMPGGGRLTIETANTRLDADYANSNPGVDAGPYVMVAISDTGTGIDPDTLARVFDPFFTTKGKGAGTGLGLSMVHGFVKQSDGHIKIYSEPGYGTTVRVYLPRATHPAEEPEFTPTSLIGGSETVLIVEDDDLVLQYAQQVLTALGYQLISAVDGPTALAILTDRDDIDLLFTDVVMPGGMSGRQLADAAATARPGLRVLYTSGYTENAIVHHGRLDLGVHLLSKPYRRTDLAHAIREALDK